MRAPLGFSIGGEVKIVKGDTSVPNNDCGVGIVFKSDPLIGGWVRVLLLIELRAPLKKPASETTYFELLVLAFRVFGLLSSRRGC